MIDWIDLVLGSVSLPVQIARFVFGTICILLLAPVAYCALRDRAHSAFPNTGLALPVMGFVSGFLLYDAIGLFAIEPLTNWRVLINVLITSSLAAFAVMLAMRWRGYEV